jgi:hypothetical protein
LPYGKNRFEIPCCQVNQAYDKQDLLTLLELQLKIEQVNQTDIDAIAPEKLKHYNKILKEQIREIQAEISTILMRFQMTHELHYPDYVYSAPANIINALQNDIKQMASDIAGMTDDLQSWDDLKSLKIWLKNYRPYKPTISIDNMQYML